MKVIFLDIDGVKVKILLLADIIGFIERKVMPNEYQDYFS